VQGGLGLWIPNDVSPGKIGDLLLRTHGDEQAAAPNPVREQGDLLLVEVYFSK